MRVTRRTADVESVRVYFTYLEYAVCLFFCRGQIFEECGGRVDIIHYHICGPKVGLHNRDWEDIESGYKAIMRDPENIIYVTIIREPREHLLSFYYFFIEPFSKVGSHIDACWARYLNPPEGHFFEDKSSADSFFLATGPTG